ncbi:MAG: hypothetical protein Q9170_005289 [Blastenia crenularia]
MKSINTLAILEYEYRISTFIYQTNTKKPITIPATLYYHYFIMTSFLQYFKRPVAPNNQANPENQRFALEMQRKHFELEKKNLELEKKLFEMEKKQAELQAKLHSEKTQRDFATLITQLFRNTAENNSAECGQEEQSLKREREPAQLFAPLPGGVQHATPAREAQQPFAFGPLPWGVQTENAAREVHEHNQKLNVRMRAAGAEALEKRNPIFPPEVLNSMSPSQRSEPMFGNLPPSQRSEYLFGGLPPIQRSESLFGNLPPSQRSEQK